MKWLCVCVCVWTGEIFGSMAQPVMSVKQNMKVLILSGSSSICSNDLAVVGCRTLDVTGCWRLTDDGFVNLLQVCLHVTVATLI